MKRRLGVTGVIFIYAVTTAGSFVFVPIFMYLATKTFPVDIQARLVDSTALITVLLPIAIVWVGSFFLMLAYQVFLMFEEVDKF